MSVFVVDASVGVKKGSPIFEYSTIELVVLPFHRLPAIAD